MARNKRNSPKRRARPVQYRARLPPEKRARRSPVPSSESEDHRYSELDGLDDSNDDESSVEAAEERHIIAEAQASPRPSSASEGFADDSDSDAGADLSTTPRASSPSDNLSSSDDADVEDEDGQSDDDESDNESHSSRASGLPISPLHAPDETPSRLGSVASHSSQSSSEDDIHDWPSDVFVPKPALDPAFRREVDRDEFSDSDASLLPSTSQPFAGIDPHIQPEFDVSGGNALSDTMADADAVPRFIAPSALDLSFAGPSVYMPNHFGGSQTSFANDPLGIYGSLANSGSMFDTPLSPAAPVEPLQAHGLAITENRISYRPSLAANEDGECACDSINALDDCDSGELSLATNLLGRLPMSQLPTTFQEYALARLFGLLPLLDFPPPSNVSTPYPVSTTDGQPSASGQSLFFLANGNTALLDSTPYSGSASDNVQSSQLDLCGTHSAQSHPFSQSETSPATADETCAESFYCQSFAVLEEFEFSRAFDNETF